MDYARLRQFERINVVGTSGSGKSTFGRALADFFRKANGAPAKSE